MSKQKPLAGLLMFLNFLFGQAVYGDDDYLHLRQAGCLYERFQLVYRDSREAVVFLFRVGHAYTLLAGTYTIADLPNCLTSTALFNELLATTSNKRGNVTLLFRLTDAILYPNRVVITSLLMPFAFSVSVIIWMLMLFARFFSYLTMITLYSNTLYVSSGLSINSQDPYCLGGRS